MLKKLRRVNNNLVEKNNISRDQTIVSHLDGLKTINFVPTSA